MSPKSSVLAVLVLAAATFFAVAAATARNGDAKIYYFGASGCDYCSNGLTFLKRYKAEDERVSFQDFDIIANPDDATLFVRVVNAIGLADPRVPMTIVGRHVIIGYEDDDTTGREIKMAVEQCRLTSCPDLVNGLMTFGPEIAAGTPKNWVVDRRFAKAAIAH
jgi:glutaredoxin